MGLLHLWVDASILALPAVEVVLMASCLFLGEWGIRVHVDTFPVRIGVAAPRIGGLELVVGGWLPPRTLLLGPLVAVGLLLRERRRHPRMTRRELSFQDGIVLATELRVAEGLNRLLDLLHVSID